MIRKCTLISDGLGNEIVEGLPSELTYGFTYTYFNLELKNQEDINFLLK